MMRFVHIKDQVNFGYDEFAFFDTTIDRFIEIDGQQVFESIQDLKDAFLSDKRGQQFLDRLLGLIPTYVRHNKWNET